MKKLTACFVFTLCTLFILVDAIAQNPRAAIDSASFDLRTGANFDFFNGLNASNLAADAELFVPDLFKFNKKSSITRWGMNLGLYENKTVTISADSFYMTTYRSSYIPDSTGNLDVTTEFGKKTLNTEIKNLGAYACLLYRLGDGTNQEFRSYLELTYELIHRNFRTDITYVRDTGYTSSIAQSVATSSTIYDIKPANISTSISEEYLSVGIQHHYQGLNNDLSYCGEILVGFFSSPLDHHNDIFFNHRNIFYNLTFALTYKKSICIAGEIRHIDFFNKNSKSPYFIVTLSKLISLESVYKAANNLLAPAN
jgi:hypothetical protein